MVKYKFTLILLVFFAGAIGIAAMSMGPEGEIGMYNPGVIVGAVIVMLCCPALIYDQKHTDEYKMKEQERKLQIQFQQKRIETAMKQQDLDLEKQQITLSQQKAVANGEASLKFCIFCGKQIDQNAVICPFCGAEPIQEEGSSQTSRPLPQTQVPQPPIIIQQAPKQSIWAQLGAWIIQQIVYFIIISVMTVFMVVMLIIFMPY